jgi:DNA-binding response OmpR family regulator
MSLEAKTVYEFGPFRLDVEQHSLFRDGQLIPLTPKALGTLLCSSRRRATSWKRTS